jgi:hypothetical protein
MFRNPIFSTIIVTTCLVLYQVLCFLDTGITIALIIFLISPLLMIWLVLSILKDKKTNVKQLKEDEEWGYNDVEKDSLGVF